MATPLRTGEFVAWLTAAAGVEFKSAYELVAEVAEARRALPDPVRAAQAHASAQLSRAAVARVLEKYYRSEAPFYRVAIGDQESPTPLTVLSDPSWIGHMIELGGAHESVAVVESPEAAAIKMTPAVFHAAIERLGVAEADGIVMAENSLYRLVDIAIAADHLTAHVALTTFSAYALTTDLMASELLAHLADPSAPGGLPVRDHYLRTAAAATHFEDRICAGGTPCLLPISRGDDYALLVQRRAAKVLNTAGRLAVVPKAIHQPLTGGERQSALSTTIDREFEEELLGRAGVDRTTPDADAYAVVVPGHDGAATEPMRWLRHHPASYFRVCTAFGINMVSGNYEAPCLVVIDDPTWWTTYGDRLQKNWEIGSIEIYSSLDTDGLSRLLVDPRWADEALFSIVEGLRSLQQLRPDMVRLPRIEVRA